jgi:hypothetical protein
LSNCTIPHSGHGYVRETTEEPGALTATSPVAPGIEGFPEVSVVLVGAGTGCALDIAVAFRVSVLKKSLALRPGSAASLTGLGRNKLLQPKEPDKQNTSKRNEIFRSFFIVYLLVFSAKQRKKIILKILNPLLCCLLSLGTTFVNFICYIGTCIN